MIRREEGRKKLRIHIVQKGDTLWKIAKEYGISFEDLKRLNVHLANPDYIVPGMEIILPEKINKELHRDSHKEMPKKETQVHKETPTKESPKKEVQRPMPPPPPIVPPPPAPMPMPEPQMIPIPIPMPMPMQMPQQPMWVPQPVEMNWHQQVVMPQVEQTVTPPPVQIQPPPPPAPTPPPPPVAKPKPMPVPQPAPQPPMHIMPQMPVVPHCSSCHQPIYHHQMWWPMQMQPQVEHYAMPQPPMSYDMPDHKVGGMEDFLESTSPFFPTHDEQMKPQFDMMPNMNMGMPDMNMGQSCGCGSQPMPMPMPMPDMNMGQSCGCGTKPMPMPDCGCHNQPMMMPNWQMDPCQCQPPCPSGAGPWMSPHYFPGGMTPYRW